MTGHPDHDALDEAHGTSTHPERYRVLHGAAIELIENLVEHFTVERVDGVDLDARAAGFWPGARAVQLVPADAGTTVVFTFTPFPGLMVGFGHNGHESFPACGCDLCAENPQQEVARLAELVRDVVAGGFSETVARGRRVARYECNLVSPDGAKRTQLRRVQGTDRPQPAGTTSWPAWTVRRP